VAANQIWTSLWRIVSFFKQSSLFCIITRTTSNQTKPGNVPQPSFSQIETCTVFCESPIVARSTVLIKPGLSTSPPRRSVISPPSSIFVLRPLELIRLGTTQVPIPLDKSFFSSTPTLFPDRGMSQIPFLPVTFLTFLPIRVVVCVSLFVESDHYSLI